eukprot:6489689-Amphidinium_carterae.5
MEAEDACHEYDVFGEGAANCRWWRSLCTKKGAVGKDAVVMASDHGCHDSFPTPRSPGSLCDNSSLVVDFEWLSLRMHPRRLERYRED